MKNIIACKNYQSELEKATDREHKYYYHYPVCLDNKLLNKDIVQEIIEKNSLSDYTVLCCDICKGTHKNKKSKLHSSNLCFYQLLNKESVDYFIRQGYYLVTPGWLKNWRQYVEGDWDFTREIAIMFFKDAFNKVMVLDSGIDENVENNLEEFCRFIEKEYEILPVGLDYYKLYIEDSLSNSKENIALANQEKQKMQNQLINYTMSVDLIRRLSEFTNEDQILEKIYDILRMMFMPNLVCFIGYANKKWAKNKCKRFDSDEINDFISSNETLLWLASEKGFASKLFYGEDLIGILILDDIYLAEYKETYYNTYLSIVHIISLALHNTRLYEQVVSLNIDYEKQKSYFEQLFKNSPDMILITNNELQVQSLNESFMNYFPDNHNLIGEHINDFFKSYESRYEINNVEIETKKEKPILQFKINQSERSLELSIYPIFVLEEQVGNYIILIDITSRIQMQKELRNMAFQDSLTGLYNRAFCDLEMVRLASNRQLPMGVIIGDVNGLKITNDAFGHLAGDKLLKQIANIMKDACRTGDVISRWGGDEYVILLPYTPLATVKKITERIIKSCSNFENYDFVTPSISMGYAVLKTNKKTITQVFVEAEEMMYENKLLQKSSIRNSIVSSLESSLFEKSYETEEHAIRVSEMCKDVGKELNFNNQQLSELELLGRLHDIGKLLVDTQVLNKSNPLSNAELAAVKEHSESGYRIAKSIPELAHIANFILAHHERWDGLGYPNKISNKDIPIQSRILSIADSIDAMRSERPYKSTMSEEEVFNELLINKGTQFDPTLIDLFIKLYFTK